MANGYRTRLKTIDTETGEVLEGVPVYIAPKIHLKEGWFMGFQDAFIALAADKDLTGETYKVFMYMLGHLGFENYIAIPQVQIAKDLGMHKEHVSRAIKVLINKRIILEGPKLGRTKTYRLNSDYGWRGTVRNLTEHRKHVVPFPKSDS